MKRLHSLEAAALSGNMSIGGILHIALDVAVSVGDRVARQWLNEESRGYAFGERIPDYRRVTGRAGMTVKRAWHNFEWTDPSRAAEFTTWPLQESAERLEQLAHDAIAVLKPLDRLRVAPYIHETIPPDVTPQLSISVGTIRAVLMALRHRIYEWSVSIPDPEAAAPREGSAASDRDRPDNTVFIVHGRNHEVRDRIDLFLTKEPGLRTVVLEAGAMRGMTIPEKFETAAGSAGFAIFILTADDVLSFEGRTVRRARQNVILEIGYFWGLLGRRDRVAFLVENHPEMELPSDIQGVGWIAITQDLAATKQKLQDELRAANVLTA